MDNKTIFEWAAIFQEQIQNGASQSDIIQMLKEYESQVLRQPLVVSSACDGCGSKLDAMDIKVRVCYCCQKEIKQTDL